MTIRELAEALGVSRATVSRVLHEHPTVKAETRERVLQAIRQEGVTARRAARAPAALGALRFAVLAYTEPASYWRQVAQSAAHTAAELAHCGVTVDFFQTDILRPAEQTDKLAQLVRERYDGVALAPNDPACMAASIDAAVAAGTRVILFNCDVPGANRLAYIGSDYDQAGMLAAELIGKTMDRAGGRVAVLTLEEPLLPIEQRLAGFRKALAEYPRVQVARVCRFPRSGGDVYRRTLALLEGEGPDALFVTFGGLADAARALEEYGGGGRIPLVGFDCDDEIVSYLRRDIITATIGHEPRRQVQAALQGLLDSFCPEPAPLPSIQLTRLEVLMRHNAGGYL